MPRPRVHATDAVLDAAEELLAEQGRAGLTVRTLALRAGVSNGSIYHAFGSVDTVVASTWLRRARQFLELQRAAVDTELQTGDDAAAHRAVLAAADSPAQLAEQDLPAARLLTAMDRDDLLTDAVAPAVAADLRALDGELAVLLRRLAAATWQRTDRATVEAMTTCVVRLPTALLFGEIRGGQVRPVVRAQLAAAVRGVLSVGPG